MKICGVPGGKSERTMRQIKILGSRCSFRNGFVRRTCRFGHEWMKPSGYRQPLAMLVSDDTEQFPLKEEWIIDMSKLLLDKVVVLTGSRRGIGAGTVQPLLDAGATVVGCAKGPDPVNEIPVSSRPERNRYYYRRCDVSSPEEMGRFISFAAESFGRIDCLINNAGVHPPTKTIDAFTAEEFEELFRINLLSMFVACKTALPYLRKVRGTIINMGSAVGKYGQEGAAIYCATKGGISGFTKALAIDEGRYGVRVNAILPGSIWTPATDDWCAVFENPTEKLSEIERWSWMNRLGTVKECADAIVFLASDMSGFITGHELMVTGGTELGYGVKSPPKGDMDEPV